MGIIKALFGVDHARRVQAGEYDRETPAPTRMPFWMSASRAKASPTGGRRVQLLVPDADDHEIRLQVERFNGQLRNQRTGLWERGSETGTPKAGHVEISVHSDYDGWSDAISITDPATLDHLIDHLVIARQNMVAHQLSPVTEDDRIEVEA